jgi:isopenicillin-N N-acyltransferase like protein
MMTEAGIIGKIGLNSAGVGVTLNAVKAKGVDFSRLPCHLALRSALESFTCAEAVLALERVGVAAPCHILIADLETSAGLECTAFDVMQLGIRMQNGSCLEKRFICHTNHFIEPHMGPNCHPDLPDSTFRLERVNELLNQETAMPSFGVIEKMLRDEANFPGSICRDQSGRDGFATLFSIVMDLKSHKAEVRMGKPTELGKRLTLEP